MDITVCICTHDRPGYLGDCLDGLRRQTVGAGEFDILVVDSASTGDAPGQIVRLVADVANARLLRVDTAGISLARNAGAEAARGSYIAYIDDDAIPAPDWIERILAAIAETDPSPALIGGRILPHWEAPLPAWWPPQLRGTLSIIEFEGQGEYRTAAVPPSLEPYGANMVVHVPTLLALGGFGRHSGRVGTVLLSDEEVQLAWRLQAAGFSARYDPRIVVQHQIQAARLSPRWLLSRLYWQGVSTVLDPAAARRPRRGVAGTAAPARGSGCAGAHRSVAAPQHASGTLPLAAGLCGGFRSRRARTKARSERVGGVRLYRWQGAVRNFGDELNTLLWPRLLPNFFDDDPTELFLGIGSVLDARHDATAVKVVAGAGYGGYQALPALDASWVVHWVRGPRTARLLGLPEAYGLGDPAMLLAVPSNRRRTIDRVHAAFREPGARRLGRGGHCGGYHLDRSARRSGRHHRRDRRLPPGAQRGDARRHRRRRNARAMGRAAAACTRAPREMARLGGRS